MAPCGLNELIYHSVGVIVLFPTFTKKKKRVWIACFCTILLPIANFQMLLLNGVHFVQKIRQMWVQSIKRCIQYGRGLPKGMSHCRSCCVKFAIVSRRMIDTANTLTLRLCVTFNLNIIANGIHLIIVGFGLCTM